MRIDHAALKAIADELAPYSDDHDLFWDTLDGETDVMDMVGAIIQETVEADAMIAAIDQIIAKYNDRRDAMRGKKDRLKVALRSIMIATGQRKIPHALATISMRQGVENLVIYDEEAIPSQLCRVVRTPDRTEIKKQLKAGVTIEGARLEAGPETVSMRMK